MNIIQTIACVLLFLLVLGVFDRIAFSKEHFQVVSPPAAIPGANNMVLTDENGNLSSIQFPKGMIMMWNGSANAIPQGWAFCDGTNGTPDLRGRFILGANLTDWSTVKDPSLSVNRPDQKGGSETVALTLEQMPRHRHANVVRDIGYYGGQMASGASFSANPNRNSDFTGGTSPASGVTDAEGPGQAHNNMPPYYVLSYIMKL